MTKLFDPVQLRGVEVPNRMWMSPMCTYSAEPSGELVGQPTDFHLAHYGARAAGGAGLVIVEATGVSPQGRISPFDLGLWDDAQVPSFRRLATVIAAAGAVPALQLAHAGRKASVDRPQLGGDPLAAVQGGWTTLGPSNNAFPGYPSPTEISREDVPALVEDFAAAARRALSAGFEAVEIHAAHGYLLHSFLSPLSNHRRDDYGGSLENRARIVLEIIDAVRTVWPQDKPVLLRVSTTDWVTENSAGERRGWGVDETIQLSQWAGERGVDLVDCSSGGLEPTPIPPDVDYQTRLAAQVRDGSKMPVGAVGRITEPGQAAELISSHQADVVLLGRALLRDASWPNNAARALGNRPRFVEQYEYALPR